MRATGAGMLGIGFAIVASLLSGCDNAPLPGKPAARTPGYSTQAAPADGVRANQLQHRLERDPLLAGSEIRVQAAGEHIRLSGFVHSTAAKLRAGELAQELSAAVDNRLIVRRLAETTSALPEVVLL